MFVKCGIACKKPDFLKHSLAKPHPNTPYYRVSGPKGKLA
jgi:hypothetical protein